MFDIMSTCCILFWLSLKNCYLSSYEMHKHMMYESILYIWQFIVKTWHCTIQIIKYVSLKKEKEKNHRDNTKST